jgi:hypothetical protein
VSGGPSAATVSRARGEEVWTECKCGLLLISV